MRARLDDLVNSALAEKAAVPAFTCYDFTTALAVVEEAEAKGRGVILLVAPKTAAARSGLRLIAALRGLADAATVPVVVQLDHATSIEAITTGLAAGADSVLADGSALDFEENIEFVAAVRSSFADPTIVVEAELGGLAGNEDQAFALEAAGLTDATQVADFIARSGAQLLAVAVGNVHGKYAGEPLLHWDLLDQISAQSAVPLVLHGASGIPAEDLAKAPAARIGKVNFNTELRTGVLRMLELETTAHRMAGENLVDLLELWRESVRNFTDGALKMLQAEPKG
ncbi:class II fructose-bisphosphate aldolase [Arthrobacter antibioticus]|uniref:class II fructose-bisphosphate aldolase n=1 Tax=Arthrobacter sp. H35-MC1 TaxID=3046203 RepID=UPI0024B8BC1B|nr:class II fructose-bisphosphate aldolase [Arthrobacter sp. H35-MC1]MDJ0317338.1 class II fructose-bisphosphate aldolase [Arthrobacter sp. H35-MC1]